MAHDLEMATAISREVEAHLKDQRRKGIRQAEGFAPPRIVQEAMLVSDEIFEESGQRVGVTLTYATQSYFARKLNEERPIGVFSRIEPDLIALHAAHEGESVFTVDAVPER